MDSYVYDDVLVPESPPTLNASCGEDDSESEYDSDEQIADDYYDDESDHACTRRARDRFDAVIVDRQHAIHNINQAVREAERLEYECRARQSEFYDILGTPDAVLLTLPDYGEADIARDTCDAVPHDQIQGGLCEKTAELPPPSSHDHLDGFDDFSATARRLLEKRTPKNTMRASQSPINKLSIFLAGRTGQYIEEELSVLKNHRRIYIYIIN